MGLIIDTDDFTGRFHVAETSFSELSDWITGHEKKYLVQLLGVELFDLFKDNLNNQVPQSARFTSIFNPVFADHDDEVKQNRGMKEMLLGFIRWEFLRDQKLKNTSSGTFVNESELSRAADRNEIYRCYNDSVHDAQIIQWYIEENSEDYPEYNGQCFSFAHWAL